MAINRFEQLRVYRQAFAAAMDIFEHSRDWPREERYALTDQIRRSSRAVCANIAEAWRKRRYPKHFVSKLSDADAEAAETRVWLRFAASCRYLDEQAYTDLAAHHDTINGGLVLMMNSPDQWCIPNHVREAEALYETNTNPDTSPLSLSPIPRLPDSPALPLPVSPTRS